MGYPAIIPVANSELIRDINRRAVLNTLRKKQPLSRADLARLTGLQRSTVSVIIEELIEQQWIVEGAHARLPRGRRPTHLSLNLDRAIAAVDIRAGHITLALSDVNGRFSAREQFPTPSTPQRALDVLLPRLCAVTGNTTGRMMEGIGISVPGRVDPASNDLIFAPNLRWEPCNLKTPIETATGLDVVMENAANACVLAEVWFGQPDQIQNMVAIAVAEGIGSGILFNGRLLRGLNGMAGEFGHVSIESCGPLCGCGNRGCWEVFASNRAAIRYYQELVPEAPPPSFLELMDWAEQGNEAAQSSLAKMATYLGRGMRIISAGLAPERIVIVGELTRAWHRFGPVIEEELRAAPLAAGVVPDVVPSHEEMPRLRGAVAMVLQKHFGEVRT